MTDTFAENIENMTDKMPDVALARVYHHDRLVSVIPNLPGKQNSLRVYGTVGADGTMDRNDIARAREIFAPVMHLADKEPGKHPNLEILQDIPEGDTLSVEMVTASEGLLEALVNKDASTEQKREGVDLLERGAIRCAEKVHGMDGGHLWLPQDYAVAAVKGTFSAFDFEVMDDIFYDKVPLKTTGWSEEDFKNAGVRFIPGSFARIGSYVGPGTTIMPGGMVNTGAYIAGDGVMIDGGARVATAAQVGKGVKLGAGSGLEGVLEPEGMLPTIVDDGAIIGANCEIAGIVEEGAVVASGTVMSKQKKVYDLRTGDQSVKVVEIDGERHPLPYIPAGRLALPGVYRKHHDEMGNIGIDCVFLHEKDAATASITEIPKNAELYLGNK